MKAVLKNLLRVKSILTLSISTALIVLTIMNPNSAEYRTALISAVSAIFAYYFNKDQTKDGQGQNPETDKIQNA